MYYPFFFTSAFQDRLQCVKTEHQFSFEFPSLPELSKNQDNSVGWFTQSKSFRPLPKASWREYWRVESVHYCTCFWHSQYLMDAYSHALGG